MTRILTMAASAMATSARIATARTWSQIRRLSGERLLRIALSTLSIVGGIVVIAKNVAVRQHDDGFWAVLRGLASNSTELWCLLAMFVLGFLSVAFRVRHPLVVLLAQFAVLTVTLLGVGYLLDTMIAWYVAVYLGIRLPLYLQSICDVMMLGTIVMQYADPAVLAPWLSIVFLVLALAGMASSVRSIVLDKQLTNQQLHEAQRKTEILMMQKEKVEKRSRMANELHDAVGHGLTSIIALSQGGEDALANDADADPDAREAFGTITVIARESLNETRRLLESFREEDSQDADEEGMAAPINQQPDLQLRDWDDIQLILQHARSTGVLVPFTETGRRSDDPRRADLCFAITREAITNALRHATKVSRIAVAWDHEQDGGTSVIVRNDGRAEQGPGDNEREQAPPTVSGSGLKRLRKRVEKANGSLAYGPGDDGEGWVVRAMIP